MISPVPAPGLLEEDRYYVLIRMMMYYVGLKKKKACQIVSISQTSHKPNTNRMFPESIHFTMMTEYDLIVFSEPHWGATADYEIENCEDDAECNLPIIDYRLLECAQ